MFHLTIVNKIFSHCHSWLARQYLLDLVDAPRCPFTQCLGADEFSLTQINKMFYNFTSLFSNKEDPGELGRANRRSCARA